MGRPGHALDHPYFPLLHYISHTALTAAPYRIETTPQSNMAPHSSIGTSSLFIVQLCEWECGGTRVPCSSSLLLQSQWQVYPDGPSVAAAPCHISHSGPLRLVAYAAVPPAGARDEQTWVADGLPGPGGSAECDRRGTLRVGPESREIILPVEVTRLSHCKLYH